MVFYRLFPSASLSVYFPCVKKVTEFRPVCKVKLKGRSSDAHADFMLADIMGTASKIRIDFARCKVCPSLRRDSGPSGT